MSRTFTDSELEAYLDEALATCDMAAVEEELRRNASLVQRLAAVNARRDAGVHTLGEIWRRHRVSCPTREQLGCFLLQTLDNDHAEYVRFHLELVGCRVCQANLADLRAQHDQSQHAAARRSRYLKSSAGYLRRK